jgi:proteasome activator subunit 4
MGELRSRPRTFPYSAILPYKTESEAERLAHLNHIITNLYVAIKGDDLKGLVGTSTGSAVTHWTRELRGWLELKFDMPMEIRIKLVKLYYSLALAGSDGAATDKFINMFCMLCKDDQFQEIIRPKDLNLDWKTLIRVMKKLAFPGQSVYDGNVSKQFTSLSRLAHAARTLIDPNATIEILKEVLPEVSFCT